jgi:hypothetical protein
MGSGHLSFFEEHCYFGMQIFLQTWIFLPFPFIFGHLALILAEDKIFFSRDFTRGGRDGARSALICVLKNPMNMCARSSRARFSENPVSLVAVI